MQRRAALLALSGLTLAGCASSDAAPLASGTVAVGSLPGAISASTLAPPSTMEPTTASMEPPATLFDGAAPGTSDVVDAFPRIGSQVTDNRVIVIGDSILASISNRYGDQLCTDLVPRRWAVEVDAEVGRRIEFGRQVLADRGDANWDAAVVMLGNNYDGDAVAFADELERLLVEIGPIPIVLVTVTRHRPQQDEVNDALRRAADRHPNVRLVDWAARTDGHDARHLLAGDGLHLSDDGQVALAGMIASEFGLAPQGVRGACLRSTFRDDSQGSVPGLTPSTGQGSG
jgi:GDSL-like Lipase/Acylhydrolase family